MTWFDGIAIFLILFIAWLESMRGFGRAALDLAGGIIIVKVTPIIAGHLTQMLEMIENVDANKAFWYAVVFTLLVLLALLVSRLVYNSTLFSMDYFDPIIGGLLGLGCGLIVAYAFLHTLQLNYGSTEAGKLLMHSLAGQELLQFRSFNAVIKSLQDFGS